MNVKGLAFNQFKAQIIYTFGEERLNGFFKQFKVSHPFFNRSILPTTKIPIEEYIAFLDAMLKEFYNSNEKIYWKLGRLSARFILTGKGPFRVFLRQKRTPENFVNYILGRIWKMFYDMGSTKYEIKGNIMHGYILDLPIYHIHFEYIVMSFVEKTLELIGVTIKNIVKVKGSVKKIHYKFELDLQ